MASPEYHRKQAELLAGLALTSPDPTKAERLSLLALEHHALAGKREPGQSPSSPPPLRGDHNRDHA
jgi:hypothetical protein